MPSLKMTFLAAATAVAALAGVANAASYQISVVTGVTGGGFSTTNTAPGFSGSTASATFTYTGDLSFINTAPQNGPGLPLGDLNSSFGFSLANISGYSGGGTVTVGGNVVANFGTVNTFLTSSGSASGFSYASYYTIVLGALLAGTNLTITHDDGISLYRNGVAVGSPASGPTTQVTDNFTNLAAGNYTLYYSRQNGTPSVLTVQVPEPMSLALLGSGLLGLGLARRRRKANAA